jgi:2-methylisocitrate lyase-like PEP mutase family enzyme
MESAADDDVRNLPEACRCQVLDWGTTPSSVVEGNPSMSLQDKAELLRSLHVPGRPLVLANVWDAGSAVVAARAGAPALATTSAGLAWSLGAADGDRLDRDTALAAVARIAAVVDVPLSADVESGFGTDAAGVAATVRGVLDAGAVGINLEDSTWDRQPGAAPLRPVAEAAERVAAARAAADERGVPLYLNARTDVYLQLSDEPGALLEAALERAAAYVAAGASGVFVPGVTDLETVTALTKGIDAPVNILAGPGAPAVAELASAGVARVSLGSDVAVAAYALMARATQELLTSGTYESVAGGDLDYGGLNAAFVRP